MVRARGSRWVCSRAEQRASPPVLYSASGGYRRTAKAPIACDFSAAWGQSGPLPWSECSEVWGADDERYFLGTLSAMEFLPKNHQDWACEELLDTAHCCSPSWPALDTATRHSMLTSNATSRLYDTTNSPSTRVTLPQAVLGVGTLSKIRIEARVSSS